MQTHAAIGLGSNLGDRRAILDRALADLAATPGVAVSQASRFFETAPVGGPPGQGPFLNAAALCGTTLGPEAFHAVLKRLEDRAGRLRQVRWGERTLDLDLLLFGDRVIESDAPTVPHPRMAFRRFVLEPLASIAPEVVHPATGRTVSELLTNLMARPLRIGLFGWNADAVASLIKNLPEQTVAEPIAEVRSEFQFLAVARTSRNRLESSPLARSIPALWLDPSDPEEAGRELRAACLSAF